jgi:flagellar biosynthesis protein FlhG
MDQAEGLRTLATGTPEAGKTSGPPVRVISITSGKGGVGKTSLSVNLGALLQRMGRNVVLFDADLGLANVDVMLGIAPKWNLSHVVRGEKQIDEILVEGPDGMQIFPASSGIEDMAQLTSDQKMSLLAQFDAWERPVDYMIIDTSAGLGDNVVHFNQSAQENIVVVTPEPTSITDAYALIKVLSQNHGLRRFHIVFNQVKSAQEAKQLFENFLRITDQFLDVALTDLGHILADPHMPRAIRRQRALVDLYPGSEAVECMRRIARLLDRHPPDQGYATGGLSFFWRRMTIGTA